jgi:hypothetical protein
MTVFLLKYPGILSNSMTINNILYAVAAVPLTGCCSGQGDNYGTGKEYFREVEVFVRKYYAGEQQQTTFPAVFLRSDQTFSVFSTS